MWCPSSDPSATRIVGLYKYAILIVLEVTHAICYRLLRLLMNSNLVKPSHILRLSWEFYWTIQKICLENYSQGKLIFHTAFTASVHNLWDLIVVTGYALLPWWWFRWEVEQGTPTSCHCSTQYSHRTLPATLIKNVKNSRRCFVNCHNAMRGSWDHQWDSEAWCGCFLFVIHYTFSANYNISY